MHKKFDVNSVKVFDLIRPEARVWNKLEKALQAEGVSVDAGVIERLIEFAKAFIQYTDWKKVGSKRDWENNLKFRINTIRRLVKQLKLDDPVVDDFLGSDYLKRQINFALIEKATLIYEHIKGIDVRDTSNMDKELSKIVNELKLQKMPKPVDILALAIHKSGILKDVSKSGWSVRTLQNRISMVSSKKPDGKKSKGQSPMKLATLFLQKELPKQSGLIDELSQSISKMKDSELYVVVPKSSKFAFPYLFNEVVSI